MQQPLKRASVFIVGKPRGAYFCNLPFLCSAVLQLWWHLGVAPPFLTIFLPTLLRPLVVSQGRGLRLGPHSLCTHAYWETALWNIYTAGKLAQPPLDFYVLWAGFLNSRFVDKGFSWTKKNKSLQFFSVCWNVNLYPEVNLLHCHDLLWFQRQTLSCTHDVSGTH